MRNNMSYYFPYLSYDSRANIRQSAYKVTDNFCLYKISFFTDQFGSIKSQ